MRHMKAVPSPTLDSNGAFVVQIEGPFGRANIAQGIDDMHLVFGVENALAPLQINLVGGKDRVVLGDHRVPGDDEAVGLVIVDKGFAGNVDRTAMLMRRFKVGSKAATALLGARHRERDAAKQGEETGRQAERFKRALQETAPAVLSEP